MAEKLSKAEKRRLLSEFREWLEVLEHLEECRHCRLMVTDKFSKGGIHGPA